MNLKVFVNLLIFTIILMNCEGQSLKEKQAYAATIEEFITGALEELETVPGVGIAVVKDGKTLYQGGFGFADLEKKTKMAANTSFYIASCTKSYTALLATILDEEGVLDLDATLAASMPKIKFDPSIKADQIKLRDFLNHTAGVDHISIAYRLAYTGQHNHKILVDLLKYLEPNEAGYGKWDYTNLGYNIYTIILEEKTGKPWQQWLEEKVFNPAGLDRTTAYMSKAKKNKWPLAKPYIGYSKEDMEAVYLLKKDNTMQSAGGLITTAEDAATWMNIQLQEGKLNGKTIFPAKTIKKTHANPVAASGKRGRFAMESYSRGWSHGDFEGRKITWHSGGFPGYMSVISFMPEENMGVTVFVNEGIKGFYLMHLLTDFAYDALLQPEGWKTSYEEEKDQLVKQGKAVQKRIAEDRAKRAKRTWTLTQPFKNYTGTFTNDLFGTFSIKQKGKEKLEVTMGNMHCIATPFTKKNTIRVELQPGSGEVVKFEFDDGKVASAEIDGIKFLKQ